MSNREIERQIRSKELQIQRLEAEIREAKGYIRRLRETLGGAPERRSLMASPPLAPAS